MAEHAGKTLRSLRKLLAEGVLPPASIQQSGSDPEQWDWEVVKPILERVRRSAESLSVPALAKKWGVGTGKIYTLIHNGELKAINTSIGAGKRPRYSISRSAIEECEQKLATVSRAVVPTRRPRAPDQVGSLNTSNSHS